MLHATPTIFVVDPDASVQSYLERQVRRQGWNVETFGSAGAFLARRRLLAPGCLLLEVNLPDLDGFDLQRRVASERKELPVIVMSAHADIPMAVRAMKAGAVELLLKPLAEENVLGAVRQAIARSLVTLPQELELLALRERVESLSTRERQVMGQVVSGLLNKQVGARLGISEITVKAHRGRVMKKMGADSLAGLVGMALRLGPAATPATV